MPASARLAHTADPGAICSQFSLYTPLERQRRKANWLYTSRRMDDAPPRLRNERTGKHYCIRCLSDVPADVYLRNDHICDDCAALDEYPLKSTPDPKSDR